MIRGLKKPNIKDLLVLVNLRKNSRNNLTDISRNTSIPVTTVFEKVKRLNTNFIKKHTSLIDFAKLGYNTRVNVAIRATKKKELLKFLQQNPNVNSIYQLEQEYDFYVELIFRNLKELEEFTESIEEFKIKKYESHHIIEDLKREEFLTDIGHLKIHPSPSNTS